VLAAACNPDTYLPPSAALAGADDVVTSTTTFTDLYHPDDRADHTTNGLASTGHRRTAPPDTAARTSPRSGPWLGEDEDWDYDAELADHDDTEGR
jgi:hypothetical protein